MAYNARNSRPLQNNLREITPYLIRLPDQATGEESPKTGSQQTVGQIIQAIKIAAKAMGQPNAFVGGVSDADAEIAVESVAVRDRSYKSWVPHGFSRGVVNSATSSLPHR